MANLICLIITIAIILYRIYIGQYTVGGEIFILFIPSLIKFFWSYYKAEKQSTKDYIKENPHEFD